MAIEDGKNAEGSDAALSHECGEARLIEGMKDPVTDRLPQTAKIMKQGLRLGAELVLIGLSEVPPIEGRKVGVRMKRSQNEAAFGMQDTMPFPKGRERRGDVWQ